jgi:hypothetical protein
MADRQRFARLTAGFQQQAVLHGAQRRPGFRVLALQLLRQRLLRGEPRLQFLDLHLARRELRPQAHHVVFVDVRLQPVRGRHVQDAAHLPLQPVHLHGMAGAEFVAFGLELRPPGGNAGQKPPLGQSPRAPYKRHRQGKPSQPAHKKAERKHHGGVDHYGSGRHSRRGI